MWRRAPCIAAKLAKSRDPCAGLDQDVAVGIDEQTLSESPEGHFVTAVRQGVVVQREGGPFAVARETRAESLGEEPLETAKRARQGLAFHHRQGLVREGSGLGVGELSGSRNQRREHFDVTGYAVGHVETRRGDGVQARSLGVGPSASSNDAGGIGEGTE